MNRARIIAAVATVIIALAVVTLMMVCNVTALVSDREWPPKHTSEITIDDEYVEVIDLPYTPVPAYDDNSRAFAPEVTDNNRAEAAPATGHDMVDDGDAGSAPEPVTAKAPSPVKQQKPAVKKPKEGPAEKAAREREEARRRASASTISAFDKAKDKNNTSNAGRKDGDAGTPAGSSSAVNGSGSGTVGGGWIMPRYAKVNSPVTGSVKIDVKIDRTGKIVSLSFAGGNPPAANDPAVRAACEREVRAHRFTRSNRDDAPDEATAHITYIFK